MSRRLGAIQTACKHLREDRFVETLEVLGAQEPDCSISRSLSLTARGLILEREGRAVEAAVSIDEAYDLGIPLPALLRQWARYFKRSGQFERAYQCYSLLANVEPQAINEFFQDLPAREVSRYAAWGVKQLLSRPRPAFYALQPIKDALARQLDPEAAAFAFAQMAGYRPGWAVRRMQIRSLRDFAREQGLVYEELAPSREVFLPPPPLYGVAPREGVHATTRAMFFCELSDVVVSSKSSFLLKADEALFDVQDDELERFALDLDLDPVIFGPDESAAAVLIGRRALKGPALESGFPLTGVTTFNFGHWLLEYLPKVLACLGRPGFTSVPILIDQQMPSQHREALELFVDQDQRIVALEPGDAVRVKKLWTCSAIAYLPLGPKPGQDPDDEVLTRPDALTVDADAFAALIAKAHPALSALDRTTGPRKIFLTRKDSQHRRIVNREEVEAWFDAHGFTIFDFGEMSFREQVAVVRGADVVVGPDGSSNLISLFARPGTRIGILTNVFAEDNEWYTLVCRALDQPLLILTGETVTKNTDYRTFSDYRIDVGLLPEFLDELCSMS